MIFGVLYMMTWEENKQKTPLKQDFIYLPVVFTKIVGVSWSERCGLDAVIQIVIFTG